MTEHGEHPRQLLGAFVLGHLEPGESAAIEAHLDGCASCREEERELAAVARLLPAGDPARLGASPAPPPSLLDDVLVRIEGEREDGRRRRRRTFVLRAGVAAAILALTAFLVVAVPAGPGGEVVALAATRPGVIGEATVHADPGATWVELRTTGLPAGETYAVWLEEEGTGERYRCGTFTGVEGPVYISLYSPLTRDRAVAIGVSTLEGEVVMRSSLPARAAV
jgi:hypothetical protein